MWESTINFNEVREIRGKVTTFFGIGSIEKINDIATELRNKGIDSVLITTTKGAYKTCGAWDYVKNALENNDISYKLYDKVSPNPNAKEVDEATKMAIEFNAKAVIAIGGGSAIDAGKSAAIMINYPQYTTADLYEYNFVPQKALPIIAINTTHGTGSETNRFAVASILEKQYKPAIVYDIIYPMYSIDDPKLMVTLPKDQTIYTAIDAVNHVFEACTTVLTSPYTIMLAKEVTRLVDKYLPVAIEDGENLEARYYLTYASLIAGICFDNGMLHFTHALEHPLSALKPELAHGLGLAVILPAIAKYTYEVRPEILADVLSYIMPGLEGKAEEAQEVGEKMQAWLRSFGIEEDLNTLGFKEQDIERLVDLAFNTPSLNIVLSCAPTVATKELLTSIYKESLNVLDLQYS